MGSSRTYPAPTHVVSGTRIQHVKNSAAVLERPPAHHLSTFGQGLCEIRRGAYTPSLSISGGFAGDTWMGGQPCPSAYENRLQKFLADFLKPCAT